MSFTVKLWSFSKAPNSTAQPTGAGTQYSCVSNDDFNVIEPRIPLQIGAAANPTSYNYMQISDFGRYYWVTRWAWESGLWVAYCRVDALASWKSQIGSLSAYVLRAAADYNGNLIDNRYPRTSVFTVETDGGSNPIMWATAQSSGTFVVGIAGSGATNYYVMNWARMDNFIKAIQTNEYYTAAIGALSLATNPELKVYVNPLQYITSIIWLPFQAYNSSAQTANHIYVGTVDMTQLTIGGYTPSAWALTDTYSVTEFTNTWTIKRHPQTTTHGFYVNTSAAEYSIYVPPFGKIELDPGFCASHDEIRCRISVDSRTGYSILYVYGTKTNGGLPWDLHSKVTGQIGIPYQIGTAQAPGLGVGALMAPILGAAAGAVSGFSMGGVYGAVAGGVVGALSPAMALIGDIGQSKIAKSNTVGGTPCVAALYNTVTNMCYEWYTVADIDAADQGRPLCEKRTLSTLAGYQLCTDVDVTIPCTRDEEQMIKGFLESGYFYE